MPWLGGMSGKGEKGLELFRQMQWEQLKPDHRTIVGLLNACASKGALKEGMQVHAQIIRCGMESKIFVGNSLIDMYAKCGSIQNAQHVFNKMPVRDTVSWNALIGGYVKCRKGQKALQLAKEMQGDGVNPDRVTYVGILNACASTAAIEEGRRVHIKISERGYDSDVFVGSSLIDMYAKCGSMEEAWKVFRKIPMRNVMCWNALIRGYVKSGNGEKGLELFGQMQREQVKPDHLTFVGLLNACASIGALKEGMQVHAQIIRCGLESKIFVGNSLIDMYAKCGRIENAQHVFNTMPIRDVVSWNALIGGYVKCGQGLKALQLAKEMQGGGVNPDRVTFVGILNACASTAAIEEGRRVHIKISERGYESDIFVGSSLIDMYAKCGSIEEAWKVFSNMPTRTLVSWNAMIAGYVKCGHAQKALDLSQCMHLHRVKPDAVTFVGILNACASTAAIEQGRRVHAQVIENNYEGNVYVRNSLVDMYAKCGSIDEARRVFNKIPVWNVVSWNTMIGGYVKCGRGQEALELYRLMDSQQRKPSNATFVQVLNACSSMKALEEGKHIHAQIIDNGCETDVFIGSSLVDMYTKCGSIENAWRVFTSMPSRDVVAWNAMILGYVKCGHGQKAVQLFRQMQEQQVVPEPITFVGVLNACASVAALEEGSRAHALVIQSGCEGNPFVRNSLIDMYAKCGSIENALRVFKTAPADDTVSWNALLGGYAIHGYGHEALQFFEQMVQQAVKVNRVTFVCLLSACSHAGLVDEGFQYLESMSACYGILATVEHFACMVDLLGRAGRVHEAENMIKTMSCVPDGVVWKSLLGACGVHGNVEMGEQIAQQVLELDPGNSGGYSLLTNLYVTALANVCTAALA